MRAALAAIAAALLAGCSYGYGVSGGYVRHRTSPFMPWEEAWRPAPRLAADRAVNEQDCTRPIERPTANLSCR